MADMTWSWAVGRSQPGKRCFLPSMCPAQDVGIDRSPYQERQFQDLPSMPKIKKLMSRAYCNLDETKWYGRRILRSQNCRREPGHEPGVSVGQRLSAVHLNRFLPFLITVQL